MDSLAAQIETHEHQFMRAWMQGDRKGMKALAARDFIFLLGSTNAAILDRPSWLEAATGRFRCEGYRFGEIYVRRHGRCAVFACRVDIEARMGAADWSGPIWLTDLWRRAPLRRSWKLVERVLTRPDPDKDIAAEIRRLQLWR